MRWRITSTSKSFSYSTRNHSRLAYRGLIEMLGSTVKSLPNCSWNIYKSLMTLESITEKSLKTWSWKSPIKSRLSRLYSTSERSYRAWVLTKGRNRWSWLLFRMLIWATIWQTQRHARARALIRKSTNLSIRRKFCAWNGWITATITCLSQTIIIRSRGLSKTFYKLTLLSGGQAYQRSKRRKNE